MGFPRRAGDQPENHKLLELPGVSLTTPARSRTSGTGLICPWEGFGALFAGNFAHGDSRLIRPPWLEHMRYATWRFATGDYFCQDIVYADFGMHRMRLHLSTHCRLIMQLWRRSGSPKRGRRWTSYLSRRQWSGCGALDTRCADGRDLVFLRVELMRDLYVP